LIVDVNDRPVANAEQRFGDQPHEIANALDRRDKIIACVNALAGYNPEKLAGLVRAAIHVCGHSSSVASDVIGAAADVSQLRTALAEFKGEA
jgi:hypothetical protein